MKARQLAPQASTTVAALQNFTFEIPTDRLIHAILISIAENTVAGNGATGDTGATLADDITDIKLTCNLGTIKEMTGPMCKQIGIVNREIQATGFYKLYFTDPNIGEAMPLPSWIFSSIDLVITDNAPAGSNYHHIRVMVVESEIPKGTDVTNWKVLVEKYLRWKHYGTSTGWMDFDHERAYQIFGYLDTMDDAAALSDTIFDKITLLGIAPGGEHKLVDETWVASLKQLNTMEFQQALATGFVYLEFVKGYESGQYRTLMSKVNVPTAGTNASLRVMERYLL